MKKLLLAAIMGALAVIYGCGSDGGGGGGSSSLSKSDITGQVADGYLSGAQVFLDKNLNYICDSGEPVTTTDSQGRYTLTVDPNDIGKYPVVAVAIAGQTIDLDNPTQKIAESYVLCIDKTALSGTVSNFISPVSTQIREMMETGKYATAQDAAAALRTELGLPLSTNMMADYIAGSNSAMHTAARNMASLMASQSASVMPGNRVDVNRYRGMMASVFCNLSTVRTSSTTQSSSMASARNRVSSAVSAASSAPGAFMNFSASYRFRGGR